MWGKTKQTAPYKQPQTDGTGLTPRKRRFFYARKSREPADYSVSDFIYARYASAFAFADASSVALAAA